MRVREGRRFPDHADLAGVDLAGLQVELPDRVVDGTQIENAVLDKLDRAAVLARIADPGIDLVRRLARKSLADEEFRHQAPRGRGARAEGEGLADRVDRKVLRFLQAEAAVGDQVGPEGGILRALRDRLAAGDEAPGLHAGEAAEPRELDVVVAEGRHGRGIVLHRQVFHRDAEPRLQVFGNAPIALDQPFLVLVGDRGEDNGALLGSGLPRARDGRNEEAGEQRKHRAGTRQSDHGTPNSPVCRSAGRRIRPPTTHGRRRPCSAYRKPHQNIPCLTVS